MEKSKTIIKGIIYIIGILLYFLSPIIFPILGVLGIWNNITWLIIVAIIYSVLFTITFIFSCKIIQTISCYIISLLILYFGKYDFNNYNIFLVALIEFPILISFLTIFDIIFKKKNKNNTDN